VLASDPQDGPRVLAVGGGKGGTGKSLLAANVGVFLATLGKRVVLLDAAFGAANLHTLVGVTRPQRTLADALGASGVPLDHITVPTSITNLGLIAGEGDPAWAASAKAAQLNRLIAGLRRLDADYVVIDLASGTTGNTLDLFLIADVGLVVVVPEPTSVELAYRFLRAAFVRRLRKIGITDPVEIPAEEMRMFEGGIPTPRDLCERLRETDQGPVAARVAAESARLCPGFVVNHVRSNADVEFGPALTRAVRRRFGIPADDLGYLEYDEAVWVSVRRRRPLIVEHPESRIARCIEKVVRRLLALEADKPAAAATTDSHYDLLEIQPSATEEEIRRANRRLREVYARDSVIVAGLYNKNRLDDLHLRIDQAYETLMDAEARKSYDHALFPGGVPAAAATRAATDADGGSADIAAESSAPRRVEAPAGHVSAASPRPELAPDTNFTGSLMREIREAQGLNLRDISEKTKIGIGYLAAIEDENFSKLPAVVYVRGFLVEYARMLRVSVEGVLKTYLERYKRARAELETDG
jgi:flagellar biosynthesis protein FlhG